MYFSSSRCLLCETLFRTRQGTHTVLRCSVGKRKDAELASVSFVFSDVPTSPKAPKRLTDSIDTRARNTHGTTVYSYAHTPSTALKHNYLQRQVKTLPGRGNRSRKKRKEDSKDQRHQMSMLRKWKTTKIGKELVERAATKTDGS